jgi:cytochrome c oxidase assembly factor CtaG
MGSHMMLSMVAPIFLVLAAPITLALRTLPGPRIPGERSPRQLLTSILHSGFVRVLTNPLVATGLFLGSLYALYFTNLFDTLMTNHLGHALMELHFLLVGSLFFYVLVGVDPGPRRLPPLARVGLLLVVMPFHAFFSIAIMSSSAVIGGDFFRRLDRPYRTDLLADQDLGGSLSWALGELPMVIVLIAVFVQWLRSDTREARRLDRHEDRQAPGDSALDAYNRYLRGLHAADERAGRNPTTPPRSTTTNADADQ